MPLKTDGIEEPDLNLTPMIDIVFLLIIFFMVGTQFSELEREFDVQVPKVTDARPMSNRPDALVVHVRRNGDIALSNEVLSVDQLYERLTEARKKYQGTAVVVRGDAAVPYQGVADVLSICHRAKIQSVSLQTKLDEEKLRTLREETL